MVTLNAVQTRNFQAAMPAARNLAEAERLAFAIWSESAGYIYANDGANTSNSPGFNTHPQWPSILRKSLNLHYDKIGSNGRSTGMLQQISTDVGGVWGDMAGTMDPFISATRFIKALNVTNVGAYRGTFVKTDGSTKIVDVDRDPIAADVLRVQQPLANEAESSNYDDSAVAIAKEIAARFYSVGGQVGSGANTLIKPKTYLAELLHWT